jgi:hypothetical protein
MICASVLGYLRRSCGRRAPPPWSGPAEPDASVVIAPQLKRLDSDCAPRRGCAIIPVIVIHRQEVRPMYAVSVMGAPLQRTIPRLR